MTNRLRWLILPIMTTAAYATLTPLRTAPKVDLSRYMGPWYEIATFPSMMENGCTDVVVYYTLRKDGDINLVNTCFKGEKFKAYRGRGKVDHSIPAKWYVKFFLWLGTDYVILDVDPSYRFAVVGVAARNRLWIISRTPTLDDVDYNSLLKEATSQGFDVSKLVRTVHTGKKPDSTFYESLKKSST